MKTIYEFKKGDTIVRISPAKSLGPMLTLLGDTIERGGDRSYMGEKMIFMGIANGQIYLKRTNESDIQIFGDKLIDLSLDIWSEGWNNWVDPENIIEEVDSDTLSKSDIKKQIQKAIELENYELADKLQNKLDKLTQ